MKPECESELKAQVELLCFSIVVLEFACYLDESLCKLGFECTRQQVIKSVSVHNRRNDSTLWLAMIRHVSLCAAMVTSKNGSQRFDCKVMLRIRIAESGFFVWTKPPSVSSEPSEHTLAR